MNLLVQKYAGSSLKTPKQIRTVADRAYEAARQGPMVVVVSAVGDSSHQLMDLARMLATKSDRRELNMQLSTGDQVSALLFTLDGCLAVPDRPRLGAVLDENRLACFEAV